MQSCSYTGPTSTSLIARSTPGSSRCSSRSIVTAQWAEHSSGSHQSPHGSRTSSTGWNAKAATMLEERNASLSRAPRGSDETIGQTAKTPQKAYVRFCEACSARFEPVPKRQRFCSARCRTRYHRGSDLEHLERGSVALARERAMREQAPRLAGSASLDELAAHPERAAFLPREVLLALHGRAVAVFTALAGPLLASVNGKLELQEPYPLLTAREAAEHLNVPVSWVRERARTGRLPSVRLGHYRRFRLEDLERYREEGAVLSRAPRSKN